jgi:transcriptional regulator with XRE-family HTH domain
MPKAKSPKSAATRPRRRPDALHSDVDVGERLRAERERRQVSLRGLAREIGISPSALSQIETGRERPSVSTLYAIVSELDMSLDELLIERTRPDDRAKERQVGDEGLGPMRDHPPGVDDHTRHLGCSFRGAHVPLAH